MEQESFWEKTWKKSLQEYLLAIPRTGVFLSVLLNRGSRQILEIACGSGRDSISLAKNGYNVIASDIEPYPLLRLKNMDVPPNISYMIIDGQYLPFKDKSLDATFHNGLFVYLNNEEIFDILREQERVAKKYVIFFVHNGANSKLVKKFNLLSRDNKLYKINFFTPKDIESIILQSGLEYKNFCIFKFGGKIDKILGGINHVWTRWFHQPIPMANHHLVCRTIYIIYQIQMWRNTERIACLLELK